MRALWMVAFAGSLGLATAVMAEETTEAVEAVAPAEAAVDPRIGANPAIAELYAEDPAAAEAILAAIDAINEANANRLPKGGTRSLDQAEDLAPAEQELIEANPAFGELYARDREATLKLIKLVIGE